MSNLDKLYIVLVLGVIAFIIYEVAGIGDKISGCAGILNWIQGNCDPVTVANNQAAQQGYTTGADIKCSLGNYLAGNCTDTSGGPCSFIAYVDGGCTSNGSN